MHKNHTARSESKQDNNVYFVEFKLNRLNEKKKRNTFHTVEIPVSREGRWESFNTEFRFLPSSPPSGDNSLRAASHGGHVIPYNFVLLIDYVMVNRNYFTKMIYLRCLDQFFLTHL